MEKLLNLSEKENFGKKIHLTLKCRREMIKLAAFAPDGVRELCLNFKNDNFAENFALKINYDSDILHFLEKAEELVQSRIFYTGVNYQEFFNSIFDCDEKYLANASELEKTSGYNCMNFLYIVINYIDDNFPVISSRELNFEEKRLVEFLLYSGDEQTFMKQYGVSEGDFDVLVKGICENYKCSDIKTALNFVLIEKYLKEANKTFLKVIDVLK